MMKQILSSSEEEKCIRLGCCAFISFQPQRCSARTLGPPGGVLGVLAGFPLCRLPPASVFRAGILRLLLFASALQNVRRRAVAKMYTKGQ